MADAGAPLSQVKQFQSLTQDEMLENKVCKTKDISPSTHYRGCLECKSTMHSYCSEPPINEDEGSLDRYCNLCIQEKGLYKLSESYTGGDEASNQRKKEGLYFYLFEKIATLKPPLKVLLMFQIIKMMIKMKKARDREKRKVFLSIHLKIFILH